MVASPIVLLPFTVAISTALFFSGLMWILYLSLEPYVRRHWPQTLVSWSRLVMGQLRDPLVGRDFLLGVILGDVLVLIFRVSRALMIGKGAAPELNSTDYLVGGRHALGAVLYQIPGAIQGTLLFFFILFVLRVLLRKEWLAAAVFVAIWTTLKTLGSDYPWIEGPAWTLIYAVAAMVVFRFGFVALAVGLFVTDMLLNVPLTFDFSSWYANSTLLPLLSVAALALWGFYNALAGQKLWKTELFS
jgi:serine/threonine-protein kinase